MPPAPPDLGAFRKSLCRYLDSVDVIRLVCEDIKLETTRLNLNSSVEVAWREALKEAERQGPEVLNALLRECVARAPELGKEAAISSWMEQQGGGPAPDPAGLVRQCLADIEDLDENERRKCRLVKLFLDLQQVWGAGPANGQPHSRFEGTALPEELDEDLRKAIHRYFPLDPARPAPLTKFFLPNPLPGAETLLEWLLAFSRVSDDREWRLVLCLLLACAPERALRWLEDDRAARDEGLSCLRPFLLALHGDCSEPLTHAIRRGLSSVRLDHGHAPLAPPPLYHLSAGYCLSADDALLSGVEGRWPVIAPDGPIRARARLPRVGLGRAGRVNEGHVSIGAGPFSFILYERWFTLHYERSSDLWTVKVS